MLKGYPVAPNALANAPVRAWPEVTDRIGVLLSGWWLVPFFERQPYANSMNYGNLHNFGALLLPEADDLEVQRFEFPNLSALNFVVVGLLGEGVASSTRPDPQAKGLGEYLRSRAVDIPVGLVALQPEE